MVQFANRRSFFKLRPFLQFTSRMLRLDKHRCIKMAAKCKEQQLFAVLSDLPANISENYIAEEVSLKAKQQGLKYPSSGLQTAWQSGAK